MINIQINEPYTGHIDPGVLIQTAQDALNTLQVPPNSELTIVVDGDDQLQELNRSFLGIDTPTDVLSFPADELDPDSGNRYLGDIILSLPRAQAQAETSGDTLTSELQLLVVHGVLHLLGYDHSVPGDKAIMWQKQQEILEKLGVRLARWPED